MMSPELEALRRWRAGDSQAFDQLYALVTPSLAGFCRALTRDEASAADLVQDAWKQAIARIESYREGPAFRAWLTTLAYHLWLDQRRRQAREQRILEARREECREEISIPLDRHLFLKEALARLSPEEREAVLLYSVQGLSLRETAQVLKVSHITVRVRLAKAHAILAQVLKDYESG